MPTDLGALGTRTSMLTAAEIVAGYQPLDSDLTAIAALSTTAFGRALLTLADAAALLAAAGAAAAAHAHSGADITSGTVADARIDGALARDAEVAAYAQPLDADLTAIAALTTTAFGRAFLALADIAATKAALDLESGVDVQAYDADLDAIAALAPTDDDVIQRKAGAWTNRTMAQLATDLGLAAGYQPLDSDLTAIAALATTAYGRAFLTLANQAALMALLDFGEAGDVVAVAFGDTAAAGATGEVADAGHRHAAPANPVTAHEADTSDVHAAGSITNTPAGAIAATTVQAAIDELDTEKAALAHAHTHAATTGQTANDHHNQAHTHPAEGAVVVTHASTTGQTANDHHAQAHDHSAAGDGQSLAPAGTFAFGAPTTSTATGDITGLAITASVWRWNAAGNANLCGIAGGVDGRIVFIQNITSSGVSLTIKGSSATEPVNANRIYTDNANTDYVLRGRRMVALIYDATGIRWRVLGHIGWSGAAAADVGTAAEGTGPDPARSDHVHGTGAGTPATVGTANAVGTGPAAAMTDHVHAHEAAHTAHDTVWDAAGDLVQGSGADTAAKLAITVPAANILNVLGVANGETVGSWKAIHDATNPAALGAAAPGTSLITAHRDHVHPTTGLSLTGHGAADHANATRKLFLPAALAKLDAATAANVGASPDLTGVVAYADAATQGALWSLMVPDDWDSGVITLQPVWSPGATDAVAHTVRWSIVAKAVASGSTVTAAGTTTTFTGASAARTVGVVVYDTATSTGITPAAAGDLFRFELRRIGADGADTYVGVVNLLGIIVSYTANE